MTTTFQIQLDNADVTRALQKLVARMSDMTPAMEDIGRALGNLTEDSFQDERSPFGGAWKKLTPKYVAKPHNKGGRSGNAHPILQRDGGLAASITHGGTKASAFVGASKVYAAIHQFGGTSGMRPGPRAIPARPFIPVTVTGTLAPDAKDEILDILREFFSAP